MTEEAFVDTNVFLRYLTNDVPAQADAVERVLDAAEHGRVRLVTTPLVIAEIVWTLESFYATARDDIRDMVFAILNTPGLRVLEADVLLQAAVWYTEKRVDFFDAYHAAWMASERIAHAYTFDRKHFARFDSVGLREV